MQQINLAKVACPNCGNSGAEALDADSQIEHTGRVDGEGWISCPNGDWLVEFTEDGDVTKQEGATLADAIVNVESALEGGDD